MPETSMKISFTLVTGFSSSNRSSRPEAASAQSHLDWNKIYFSWQLLEKSRLSLTNLASLHVLAYIFTSTVRTCVANILKIRKYSNKKHKMFYPFGRRSFSFHKIMGRFPKLSLGKIFIWHPAHDIKYRM